MMKNKQLKSDGAYTGSNGGVNGYAEDGKKESYLRDAKALLKQTGRILAERGLNECSVKVNPGGIAVSGDVYAEYWASRAPEQRVYVMISAVGVDTEREDAISIMARFHFYKPTVSTMQFAKARPQSPEMGRNIWLSPELDSAQLADEMLTILRNISRARAQVADPYRSHARPAEASEVASAAIR